MMVSILPRNDKAFNEAKDQTRKDINRALQASNIFDFFVDCETWIHDTNSSGTNPDYVNKDRVHLNEAGGKVLADHINITEFFV